MLITYKLVVSVVFIFEADPDIFKSAMTNSYNFISAPTQSAKLRDVLVCKGM